MKNIDPIDPPVDTADEWDRRNYSINLDDHRQIYTAKQIDIELNEIWKTIDRHTILFFFVFLFFAVWFLIEILQ